MVETSEYNYLTGARGMASTTSESLRAAPQEGDVVDIHATENDTKDGSPAKAWQRVNGCIPVPSSQTIRDVQTGLQESEAVQVTPAPSDTTVHGDIEKAAVTQMDTSSRTMEQRNYSSFTTNQKRLIIFTASVGSFFSPLTANIYLPALNALAADLHVSSSAINLTVTTYMIFQAIAPTFIGGFSDTAGRRPAYIIGFVLYLAANIALSLQSDYAALLVLRCLQSSGSAGMVALASATAADIVTSAERGRYIAYSSVGSILGPAVAPVLGGVLSQYAGWKWIFGFLAILSAVYFVILLIFHPETNRKVVDDGSVPPPLLNQSVYGWVKQRNAMKHGLISQEKFEEQRLLKEKRGPINFPNAFATLVLLRDPVMALLLLCVGLLYAAFYAVSISIPSQFQLIYHLNDLQIGLVYLPIAGGSILSAFTTGKIVDWNYRRWCTKLGVPYDRKKQRDMSDFPVERVRLSVSIPLLYLGAAAIVGFGWAVEKQTSIAAPCVLLFVIGYAIIAGFQSMSVLMVDLYRHKAATASATNNLVRCLLGAGASAAVLPLVAAIGMGWTCTLAAGLWVMFTPLLSVMMRYGPAWRKKAKEKKERKPSEKQQHQSEKGKAAEVTPKAL